MCRSVRSMITTATVIAALLACVSAGPVQSTTATAPTPSPSAQTIHYPLAGPEPTGDDDDTGECRLLGPFSLLVQAALGALALLSLVYKRWKERPQRPLKVWAFDVSKQVFGSAMLHLANLLMSMFSAGQLEITSKYKPNPCSFYLLNLGIDTTLGIPILIFILHILNSIAQYTPLANPPESIKSGNYGRPPKAFWWFKQAIIYFIGLLGMKICVFFLIQLLPFIVKVGDWALRWTEGNAAVQIIFVMLLFPVIMNAIQYYIIDTFIKKPSRELLEEEVEDDVDARGHDNDHRHALLGSEEDDTIESEDDSVGKGAPRVLESPQSRETLPRYSVSQNSAMHGGYTMGSSPSEPSTASSASPSSSSDSN